MVHAEFAKHVDERGIFFRAELIGLFRARAASVIFDSVGVSNLRRKGSSGGR